MASDLGRTSDRDTQGSRRIPQPFSGSWSVAAAYLLLTVVMTWPLAGHLASDIPSDLGDSLYFMWAIAWTKSQIVAIFSGDLGRLATFFDANAFYPEPLALAYSDHVIPQAVSVLPLFLATDNLILLYNLLFLSTFVLSGLGTYLFVREITASPRAAFVAGVFFAFAPYRLAHLAHLNLLSTGWVAFALYGLRRYFDTARRRPLVGAAAALVLQNLSSGYYLLFFTPVVGSYAFWEIARRRLWRSRRTWTELAVAGAAVAVVTAPFLLPYLALRNRLPSLRAADEVRRYAADVYAYLTASLDLKVWGSRLRAYPRLEGDLFPALVPVLSAAAAVWWWMRRATAATADVDGRQAVALPSWRFWLARVSLGLAAGYGLLALAVIYLRRVAVTWGPVGMQARDVTRLALFATAAAGTAAIASPRVRAIVRRLVGGPEAWVMAVVVIAWWLSLGPTPTVLGRELELPGIYELLRRYLPGYDGLRVPARWAMVVAFGLAVLGGIGLSALDRRRWSGAVLAIVCAAFLFEVHVAPLPMNRVPVLATVAPPERRVFPPRQQPAVYRAVGETPADAVLVELPLGRPEYDSRAMYYSTMHGRRLVNGYSGFYPPRYGRLMFLLSDVPGRPDLAQRGLTDVGATHVLVHEAAFLGDTGSLVCGVLAGWGAREVFRDGSDVLFALPPRFLNPATRPAP